MNKQQLNYIYPVKLLDNFNYIYPYTNFLINTILKENIYNYSLSMFNSTSYLNFIDLIHSTKKKRVKSRSEINKSNKKPWPQKKLGKARAGSFKSPLWKGGNKLFGPKNVAVKLKFNKKLKKLSFIYILFNKRSHLYCIYAHCFFHYFISLEKYLKQQLYLKGIFSLKVLFISLIKLNTFNTSIFMYSSISNLNIKYILKSNIIIFLI